MLKCFIFVQCLGDGGSFRVLASACLEKLIISLTVVSPHQLKHTILRGSSAARYLFHALVASMAYPKPYIRSRTW